MRKKTGLGQKKELNAELNLTSFIDLLSTCVCFLLITAVWIEIGSIEIKQSHGTSAAAPSANSYDLDLIFRGPSHMRLNLKRNGRRVKSELVKASNHEGAIEKLGEVLSKKILKYRNRKTKIATATVMPNSSVNYRQMVAALDTLRQRDIINIGVLTERERSIQ